MREEFAKIQNLNQKDKERIILRSVVAKLEKGWFLEKNYQFVSKKLSPRGKKYQVVGYSTFVK